MNAIGTPRWDIQTQSWVDADLTGSVRVVRGVPVEGDSVAVTTAEPVIPSEPDACRHSRFSIGRGKFKCCHCNEVFDFGEP